MPCLYRHIAIARFIDYVTVVLEYSVVFDSVDPMDCSPAGSSASGIFQARILEWVAVSFSWGSSWPRD